jgi:hypothetical protein
MFFFFLVQLMRKFMKKYNKEVKKKIKKIMVVVNRPLVKVTDSQGGD